MPTATLPASTDTISARPAAACPAHPTAQESSVELAALVVRARHGDELAWRGLHERLQRLILSIARRKFGIVGVEAQDVAQSIWSRISSGIGRLDDPRGAQRGVGGRPGWKR